MQTTHTANKEYRGRTSARAHTSERTYPSAAASSVLHRPPGPTASPLARRSARRAATASRLIAAATARSFNLGTRSSTPACVAHCIATSADEHAVSTLAAAVVTKEAAEMVETAMEEVMGMVMGVEMMEEKASSSR